MEELKILVDMVAHLPEMVLWVLCGFLAYKLAVIGSIYGLIRFCVDRLHSWAVSPKPEKPVKLLGSVEPICIDNAVPLLLAQLSRVAGKGLHMTSDYIHTPSVAWLKSAIDDKEAKDRAEQVTK